MSQSTTPNYKKTLNLPKTSFPMRANLAQNEPQTMKRWAKAKLYEQIIAARDEEGAEAFVFHDGPPYANGSIHAGHLLNKVLKDLVVRSQLMRGRQCKYVPGWDCHGLPIEHRVMTELVESGKIEKLASLSDDDRRMAIRNECKKYASRFIKLKSGQMQRLLTLADYDNPYLTMVPAYEKAVLEVFAALVDEGLVYRDLKPVHWSIANETALAEAELEYEDRDDPSVFVDFEADDRAAVEKAFGIELDQRPSFMIWTTTPWTLPANLAVAVSERFRYALARVDGNYTIVASELLGPVTEKAGAVDVETLAECDGAALVGLQYRHPFCDRVSPILAAEYVTLEDGTGLVHTAPGHGADDYHTGLKNGLDVYCPVRDDGTFDDTVPEWLRGKSVWEGNDLVTDHLRESGHLFHHSMFNHSYPHDWRSKTPVIFRATEQWFIGVDRTLKSSGKTLRSAALAAADTDIEFVPAWGKNRLRGMLESRPDWCLSRQRAWGLPIPAFRTADGGTFLTAASVRAVAESFGARGSDAWFKESPTDLLASYDPAQDPDAPDGLDLTSLTKMNDIFDVWFESGTSWNAVMRQRGLGYPVDLYLEGSDQHRGWFQTSLLPAIGMTGSSPYKTLLTHGFCVDKDGRKMSKSGGNALDVDDVLTHYGADVCRWWVSSLSYEGDIKADMAFLEAAGETYRKIRNTLRFLLSNLDGFDHTTMAVDLASIPGTSLDAYILQEAMAVRADVMDAFVRYDFRRANQRLYDFCNDTLSAFYCAAVKDRLYCDTPDSPRRRRTQEVMWHLLELLTRLLAPILPHTADEAYRAMHGQDASIHEQSLDGVEWHVNADAGWGSVMAVREAASKALEMAKGIGIDNSLDAGLRLPDPDGVLAAFADDLADVLGVSVVQFDGTDEVAVVDLTSEPRCERSWKRDGTVRERSDGGMLSDRDAAAVGVS